MQQLQQLQLEQRTRDWHALIHQTPVAARKAVAQLARRHAAELAGLFYRAMLSNPASAAFLSHDQVKTRLSQSMSQWITSLFSATSGEELEQVITQQNMIGQIHARVEIPVSLVLHGGQLLKIRLVDLIEEAGLDSPVRRAANAYATGLINLALEIMCLAFSQSHDRTSRAEEAYRLFSISHNIGVEKERQRASLLDWENQLMFELATGDFASHQTSLASSEFGLWFRHKASHAFQGAPETADILRLIDETDQLLPQLAAPGMIGSEQGASLLYQIRDRTRSIKYLLDSLFEQASELDAGRDVLTHLLNRKFLPVVMGKEVGYSRQSGQPFAVLALDVDYFKQINDTYGHGAGDQVLQQVASILSDNTRGGDYAFRLGGEEFLVILVDISADRAMIIAEKLRKTIEQEPFRVLDPEQVIHLTVSIGVAPHNGHPDYHQLLLRADQALYKAKSRGRNCCVLSE